MVPIIILITAMFIAYCYLKFYWYDYWNRRGIPGPRPNLFSRKSEEEVITEIYNEYKNAPVVGTFSIVTPILIVRDPELIKEITVKSFTNFHDNDFFVDVDKNPLLGRNIFAARENEWKKSRSVLSSCFSNTKVRAYYSFLEESCEKFVKYISDQKEAFNGTGIEARSLCSKYSLNTVGICAFGINPKCYENENCEFMDIAKNFLTPSKVSLLVHNLTRAIPTLNKIFATRYTSFDVEEKLKSLVMDTLKYREKNNITRTDYLNFLQAVTRNNTNFFNDVDIVAQVCAFLIDGYETGSVVMAHMLYELAKNPEAQTKLREEINETLKTNNGNLTYELIEQMEYLDAAFNEALRLNPAFLIMARICTKPYVYTFKDSDGLSKNVTIEVGTPVIIPVLPLHRDPKYFENSEQFQPQRFIGENREKILKYTFMPFGEGPRICVGRRFGLIQVKIGVIHVLKNFEVALNSKTRNQLKYCDPCCLISPVAREGMWIDFKKIEDK